MDKAVWSRPVPDEGQPADPNPRFPASRFLSADECAALFARVTGFAHGGGTASIYLNSTWVGNLRWVHNQVLSSGDVRDNRVNVMRNVNEAVGFAQTNALDDRHLEWTVRRAERVEEMLHEMPSAARPTPRDFGTYLKPKIWFDATYQQQATERAELMRTLVKPAEAAGMHSAGYLQVSATGRSLTDPNRAWYYPYTQAEFTVTVRTPDGTGSGWAGVDWSDWGRVDAERLVQVALDKCLRSRNPVALEPGRYVTILEPQAVGDLTMKLFNRRTLSREWAEYGDPQYMNTDPYLDSYDPNSPFNQRPAYSRLGQKVVDERLTVMSDCMDPDLGYPPFENGWVTYHPVTWIEDGVLKNLTYSHQYAVKKLGIDSNGVYLWGSGQVTGSYHMRGRGPAATIEEMIASTPRGILVTRFSGITYVDFRSATLTGYTRDGLWLIENGKISKPIKNFRFTDSPLFALNNVEQIGVPQRIYNPTFPIVVPALKVRDFNFTALSDSV